VRRRASTAFAGSARQAPPSGLPPPPNNTQQLIRSGERERLKQLLRDKLTECGWRDDIKQRCRGELHTLAADGAW